MKENNPIAFASTLMMMMINVFLFIIGGCNRTAIPTRTICLRTDAVTASGDSSRKIIMPPDIRRQ